MSNEFFTQVDLDAAKKSAREHDSRVRDERNGVMVIDFGCLVNDMIRFMPEGIDGEKREGYIEAVRDLCIQINGSALDQSTTDGSLSHAPNAVSVPMSMVDRALERRAERGNDA